MGLIKCIKKGNNGSEIIYFCSKCDLLIAKIHQPYSYYITLNLPNNCLNCNEQITQPVTIYEPIIDKVEFI